MNKNFILNTDSYKTSHYLQYPVNTEYVSCYIEARGGIFPQSIFFGLQAFLKEYLTSPINKENIEEAEEFLTVHGLPFNKEGWQYILDKYNGYLPIEIEAVEEGSIIPIQNVLAQVINTDPKCFWLTTYIETALLRGIWYPTTVATISYTCKQVIKKYMSETCDTLAGLEFKLHDFGARGASSFETASIGGMAHLVNFKGSDTISGILSAKKYYNELMAGYSIPAAEHSTIIAYGKENESEAYEHILNTCGGKGKLVAVVSDSYDIWHAIENIWGKQLFDKVKNHGGTLVIRPDSGDPITVVTNTIEMLMDKFGYITNSKGYKVLPDYLRVIQGDGVSIENIDAILAAMKNKKQSADNIAFGMGATLLQKLNRDTMLFAMKASAICCNGKWLEVSKNPITDLSKKSKKGRLALIQDKENKFSTINLSRLGENKNLLNKVFRNGEILYESSFQEIRNRIEKQS
ncbi:nicotinate phosphoribosyltransferase [endosymbiont of Acanthamoeba sp. UWC8]|uniref:nicotinate phosphoribosyltransferase n=1 Tax=endosymbiont of Acanthamoeba sp. UWC8 TaxID=86106 RepID=UPI0004D0E9D8|nr:nicotinate phosphoribosyltransferase [endosymbiont of Acanthamoeba sp. UWC8]AIF80824.1 nicotinate phosphoribosyltransferase [endosymbiont of Acanthamoeba sp. UWC8]